MLCLCWFLLTCSCCPLQPFPSGVVEIKKSLFSDLILFSESNVENLKFKLGVCLFLGGEVREHVSSSTMENIKKGRQQKPAQVIDSSFNPKTQTWEGASDLHLYLYRI